jgi:CMP-N-acetylneuraminic acid synthetase
MDINKLVVHIPARAGSKRLKSKNLRILEGKPMISYAIDCAKSSGLADEIYVNTDSDELADLAVESGVKVYRRSPSLATDSSTGDDFTADIIEALQLDTLMMISPVCPLVAVDDVKRAVAAFRNDSKADALITCTETQMQTAMDGHFVNIDPEGPLAPTQDNPKMQICNWAVTIWNGPAFLRNYRKFKGGYCGTHRILLPIDPLHSVKISNEADFRLVESLLSVSAKPKDAQSAARYWRAGTTS